MELRDHFWAVIAVGNIHDFRRVMTTLESTDPRVENALNAVEWLKNQPSHLWSRAYFIDSYKSDILVNNLNDFLNNYILLTRSLVIISMFEWI